MTVRDNSRTIAYSAFVDAVRDVGAADCPLLTVISDLAKFGDIESGAGGTDTGIDHFAQGILDVAGPECTIVVPTFTYSTGPDVPYSHEDSVSDTGVYTEYVRRLPGAIRSLHPALSFAAHGPRAAEICAEASPHSYGWDSVPQRLVQADSQVLSVGRSPHRGSFFIHLAEALYGVPYRYTKELAIPVTRDGEPVRRAFYHFVRYNNSDIALDTNRLVERLEKRGIVKYVPLGLSGIWAYRARDVFEATIELLHRNVYGLLDHAPIERPWLS